MIVRKQNPNLTDYEKKYFLEADTEGRPNVKHITVDEEGTKVNGQLVENPDPVEAEDSEDGDEEFDSETDEMSDEMDDFDDGDIPEEDGEDGEDSGDTEDGVATEGSEEGEIDDTEDSGGDDIPTEDSEDGAAEESEDGGSDDEVPEEDSEGGEDSGGDEGSDEDGGNDTSNEDIAEKIKKRALFQRFRILHEAIEKYVEKLNMLMAYSADTVREYQEICDSFIEIKDCLYDYMLVKFSSAELHESSLFYHRALAATVLALNDLQSLVKKAKVDDLRGT